MVVPLMKKSQVLISDGDDIISVDGVKVTEWGTSFVTQ